MLDLGGISIVLRRQITFFDKPHEPRFVQLLRNREAHDHVGSKVS